MDHPSRYFLSRVLYGWQWRDYGRNRGKYARLGNCLGEDQVECHFVEFLQGQIILGASEMPGMPQKPKWAAATITKLAQKMARTVKHQWTPNITFFPLMPCRASTTKLAETLEKDPTAMKTIFNQWVAEKAKIEDIILALLDPIWLCLNVHPQLCKEGNCVYSFLGHLSTADHSCLQILYWYHFGNNYFKIPYILLSSWNSLYFWCQGMPE